MTDQQWFTQQRRAHQGRRDAHAVRREDGAAVVEFAIVVPLLLLVVFGIVNFGFIFASQISMNSAARDAARAGVVRSLGGTAMTCAQIATQARSTAVTVGASASALTADVTGQAGSTLCSVNGSGSVSGSGGVLPCTGSLTTQAPLVVHVRLAYQAPVPLVPPTSADLKATGSFRCEYS